MPEFDLVAGVAFDEMKFTTWNPKASGLYSTGLVWALYSVGGMEKKWKLLHCGYRGGGNGKENGNSAARSATPESHPTKLQLNFCTKQNSLPSGNTCGDDPNEAEKCTAIHASRYFGYVSRRGAEGLEGFSIITVTAIIHAPITAKQFTCFGGV